MQSDQSSARQGPNWFNPANRSFLPQSRMAHQSSMPDMRTSRGVASNHHVYPGRQPFYPARTGTRGNTVNSYGGQQYGTPPFQGLSMVNTQVPVSNPVMRVGDPGRIWSGGSSSIMQGGDWPNGLSLSPHHSPTEMFSPKTPELDDGRTATYPPMTARVPSVAEFDYITNSPAGPDEDMDLASEDLMSQSCPVIMVTDDSVPDPNSTRGNGDFQLMRSTSYDVLLSANLAQRTYAPVKPSRLRSHRRTDTEATNPFPEDESEERQGHKEDSRPSSHVESFEELLALKIVCQNTGTEFTLPKSTDEHWDTIWKGAAKVYTADDHSIQGRLAHDIMLKHAKVNFPSAFKRQELESIADEIPDLEVKMGQNFWVYGRASQHGSGVS